MSRFFTMYESPLGSLTLIGGTAGLAALRFSAVGGELVHDEHRPELFDEAVAQLHGYFAGTRRHFDLRLDLGGTPFQRAVWAQLAAIPYGETRSYGRLATLVGRRDRARAVGAAVAATPVPIIIPCHRALAANGALTGYAGGLHRKRMLLDLEYASASGEAVRRLETSAARAVVISDTVGSADGSDWPRDRLRPCRGSGAQHDPAHRYTHPRPSRPPAGRP